jgi:SpoVK/Ycf46/Vps4 family AAA+-type ATPase
MPDSNMRKDLIKKLLKDINYDINQNDINIIVASLDGYSCSDIKALLKYASMNPLRNMSKYLIY